MAANTRTELGSAYLCSDVNTISNITWKVVNSLAGTPLSYNTHDPQGPLSSSLALVGSSCRSHSLGGHIRFSSCNSNSTPTLACVTSCVIAHRPIVPTGHCHLPGGSHSVYCLLFTGNSQSVTHSTVRSPPKIPSSRLHIFSVLPSVSSRTSLNSFRVSKNS